MRTPEEHFTAVRAALDPQGTVIVPLADARSRVLAASLIAEHPSPRFDNSQMDGYALSASHLRRAPASFPVGRTLAAGDDPELLYPAGIGEEVVPIMTGAKVPRETLAIVPVEDCRPAHFPEPGAMIDVPAVKLGQFIRRAGSDIPAGATLLSAGALLSPVAIAVLAGQNLTEVTVHERAKVVICTGGAEINDSGNAASTPDTNAPMLAALCAQAGIEVAAHVHTNDDPARLDTDLAEAVAVHSPTAIITSGGISAGKYEVVRQLLSDHGWFGHVDQQPGGPQGISHFHGVPVISLPGNPVSTLVSFRLFIAPTLGHAPAPMNARLTADAPGLPDREQFLRGRAETDKQGQRHAVPVGGAGSHLLVQALAADCLIHIPAGGLPAGDTVTTYPL
ncbi:molybdopterin molybdotransferase MoeA [Corynebacterium alimapuense]|uniref:Molybdopterin molybdenumtransferase n=1 Tax=Corynebacterium alimapuense TaxID=1576874 RepID=A0A3M8K6T7_9CORY|nr:molybdopterin molybdotransferase MoeA [Corynebacterium alimapuense]RNE48228.1 molybdopterin molybdenumtransferase MoeA [Corynebacterium alimapuense]